MADQQQIERLRAGVSGWNTWRAHHAKDVINLSDANLSSANLSYVDLSEADLSGTDLSEADLSGADLRNANLNGTNLSYANLSHADLSEATLNKARLFRTDLSSAKLRNATLNDATLSGANLFRADLSEADLSKATLNRVILSEATLREATLSGAYLNYADLSYADLFRADLSYADLSRADLFHATLSGANLFHATLWEATLNGTNLRNADLSSAIMGWTSFGDRDLREVKGLETIQHRGPSPLSINTLYQSESDIPEIFVRGTGAPDNFIEYMHALARKPIQYYTCFISYSSKDQHFAERLYNDLQGNGVRCWYARKDLKPGDFYRDHIDESIRVYDKVLLILSEYSVKSAWVEDEVERAWKREGEPTDPGEPLVLFPIRLDDTVMHTKQKWAATLRYLRHIGDFTGWKDHDAYQTHFQQLLHDLKQERPRTVI